jgi:hypothetical protein
MEKEELEILEGMKKLVDLKKEYVAQAAKLDALLDSIRKKGYKFTEQGHLGREDLTLSKSKEEKDE